MSDKKKNTPPNVPPRAPNGIKVYYDAEDEAYIREQARKNGLSVQQWLKMQAARQRQRRTT